MLRGLNTCVCVYRVERGGRRNDNINRDEYERCSLGEHRALQKKTTDEQKDGSSYHGWDNANAIAASRRDISHIPTAIIDRFSLEGGPWAYCYYSPQLQNNRVAHSSVFSVLFASFWFHFS